MKPAAPRIVLATLNARYIHASLGLRYLLANLDRHGGAGLRSQAVLREYTISRPAAEVVADLLATLEPRQGLSGHAATSASSPDGWAEVSPGLPATGPDKRPIIGFGVYIWNVTQTLEVIRLLKAARPDVIVVLGGPEVSHETDQQPITLLADFVITGWGDVSFAKLCRALISGPQPLMKIIPGVQPDLADIELPYLEFSDADLAHRLLYVEASRGCPFKCEFCLSSLDKTAWALELDRVLAALESLYQRGARNFKFVDRTFNLKIDHSVRVLQFFLDKLAADGGPLFLHFEVIPDHLPDRLKTLLAQFPPGVLQLEVGVQSFNAVVQKTISRRQDNAATEANLRWLLAHSHAHIHADLIFGLPGETLPSFADGFDRLLGIGPHEIQLGILKRLRGTPVIRHTQAHGMVYDANPPYTVQQTGVVDADTLQRFSRFARYWDVLANSGRFAQTLALLLQTPVAVRPAVAIAGESNHVSKPDVCPSANPQGNTNTQNHEPRLSLRTTTRNPWPRVHGSRVAARDDRGSLADGNFGVTDGQPDSPFWRFWALSDALWQRLGATHQLTPEALVDALFDTISQSLPPQAVRQALLADYLKSGARANPQALRGLLPRQPPSSAKASRTLATRQDRHQSST